MHAFQKSSISAPGSISTTTNHHIIANASRLTRPRPRIAVLPLPALQTLQHGPRFHPLTPALCKNASSKPLLRHLAAQKRHPQAANPHVAHPYPRKRRSPITRHSASSNDAAVLRECPAAHGLCLHDNCRRRAFSFLSHGRRPSSVCHWHR